MKSIGFAVMTGLLLTGVVAQAAPGGMFARMDADNDGRVTQAEFEQAMLTRFNTIDTNDDQRITREEMEAHRAQMKARWQERRQQMGMADRPEHAGRQHMDGKRGDRFARLDTDGDGAVTQAEFLGQARQRWERLDSNKDGVVSEEERASMRRHHHEKHHGQPAGQDQGS